MVRSLIGALECFRVLRTDRQAPERQTPRFSVAMVLLIGPDGRPSYPADAPKIASIMHPDPRPDASNDVKVNPAVNLCPHGSGFEAGLKVRAGYSTAFPCCSVLLASLPLTSFTCLALALRNSRQLLDGGSLLRWAGTSGDGVVLPAWMTNRWSFTAPPSGRPGLGLLVLGHV